MKKGILAVICLGLLSACGPKSVSTSTADATGKPTVLASFYPLQFFAERIAGDLADIACPVPHDADPIFWKPADADIAALQNADLILINGAGFEKWVGTTVLPEDRLVDTTARLNEPFLKYEDAILHSHGPGKAHKHEGVDGHTWMDPLIALQQAEAVFEAFAKRLPEHRETLRANFEALEKELLNLHRAFGEVKAPPVLFAEHPAYSYAARRYSWTVEHIDITAPPKNKQGLLLWESKPSAAVPGLKNIVFSPCEAPPETGDYLSTMFENVKRLRENL